MVCCEKGMKEEMEMDVRNEKDAGVGTKIGNRD